MKTFKTIVLALVVIGALNWGLWGFFGFDAVAAVARGNSTTASRVIYCIIGLAGLYALSFFGHICCCRCCCNKDKGNNKSGGCCR